MYSPGKGASSGDKRLNAAKATLNPNATEFLPFALRSLSAGISSSGASSKFANSTPFIPGKSVLDKSESSVSINSDYEAQKYWHHQLPEDITPDFKVMGLEDSQGVHSLPFSSSSLIDINEGSRFPASTGLCSHLNNGNSYAEKLRFSPNGGYVSPTDFPPSVGKPWEPPIGGNEQLLGREGHKGVNLGHGFLGDASSEQLLLEKPDVNSLEFLASQFPGFATESLAEVYFANARDLSVTMEMLTQLEIQVDGGLNQSSNSKALSTPNLSAMDFPALSSRDGQKDLSNFGGEPNQNDGSTLLFRSNSFAPSRGSTDFASAVRKMASQDNNIWMYERHGSSGANVGSSRNSQVLASSYNGGPNRGLYGDGYQSRGSARAPPVWLETGESVANMYSEMREEARDHARVRNMYFEQARQAYLIGNKSLAKELSIKGQLHNMQMKAAHGKAQETIYRQRNSDIQSNGRERMIDLHGLHVSEALHVLKRELAIMRNAARSMEQRLLVYICVGTGHHTRGSRTPARLPTAVQRYLLEEEGLDFSEPQPGLLRVVIY